MKLKIKRCADGKGKWVYRVYGANCEVFKQNSDRKVVEDWLDDYNAQQRAWETFLYPGRINNHV